MTASYKPEYLFDFSLHPMEGYVMMLGEETRTGYLIEE